MKKAFHFKHMGRFAKQKAKKKLLTAVAVLLVGSSAFLLLNNSPGKEEEIASDSSDTISVSLDHRDYDPNYWTKKESNYAPEEDADSSDISILDGIDLYDQLTNGKTDSSVDVNRFDNESDTDAHTNADDVSQESDFQTGGNLSVAFLDVGQGDSTLIWYTDSEDNESYYMLIDAGDNSCGTKVRAYLQTYGVDELDYVVCTHPDEDHIGGMASVVENVTISSSVMWMPDIKKDTKTYDNLVNEAERNYVSIEEPEIGKEYSLGDASFMFVAPTEKHSDDNNNSLVVKLWYGDVSYLLVGDCEEEEEDEILSGSYKSLIDTDVLKVGHHGSRSSSTKAFVSAVSPEYAVISCGEGNSYGHPHEETLNTLEDASCEIERTDEDGTILISTDGSNISVTTTE